MLGVLYFLLKRVGKKLFPPNTGFPVLPWWERQKLSATFKEFKKIVKKSRNEQMLDLTAVAREYMIELNAAFDKQEVTLELLQKVWRAHNNKMGERTVFDKYQNMRAKLFLMDVNHIVRHLWEHTGSDGVIKNGNDLRKVYPLVYENDVVRTPVEVFNDLIKRII